MRNQTPVLSLSSVLVCLIVWAYHNEVIIAANGRQKERPTQRPAGSHFMPDVSLESSQGQRGKQIDILSPDGTACVISL